jgi:type IV pilus assembly protein PilE
MISMRASVTRRGFTLIELMIVVGIIALLAAIAYPSYTAQVTKGNRTEGKTAVLKTAQVLERYYTTNNTYTTNLATIGMPTYSGDTSAASKYDLQVNPGAAGIATSFTIIATPRFADAKCGSLTYNQAGQKGMQLNTDSVVSDCW